LNLNYRFIAMSQLGRSFFQKSVLKFPSRDIVIKLIYD
jgi:hypothetical protein